ncbi:MAG: FAD:protein FMN transferase [Acidobacteriota bacterium]
MICLRIVLVMALGATAALAVLLPRSGWIGSPGGRLPEPPETPLSIEAVLVARARYIMGAPLEVRAFAVAHRREQVAQALDAALDEVERLDAVLSNWRNDSELSNLNRAAAVAPFICSPDLFDALEASLAAAAATGGAFEPRLEPWIAALGLRSAEPDAGPPAVLPLRGSFEAPLQRIVKLDPGRRGVSFARAGIALNLGGIGKGYALDRAARLLRERGIEAALLNFGGQVLALGAPPGEPGWIAEVADPRDRFRPALVLTLRDVSAATSANTQRGAWRDGEWIGHVLDPESGRPAPFPGSATAVAPDATRADAYATALLVMGPERGLEWADGRDDVAAAYLEPAADGPSRLRATSSFERFREAERRWRAAR